MTKTEHGWVSGRIPRDLDADFRAAARISNLSLSAALRAAIRAWVHDVANRDQEEAPPPLIAA